MAAIFPTADIQIHPFRAWLLRFRAVGAPRADPSSPHLSDLARKADDRLLRDIGVTRAEALGLAGSFERETEAMRRIWSL